MNQNRRYFMTVASLLLSLLLVTQPVSAGTETILVANDTDKQLNSNLIKHLTKNGYRIRVVHPSRFSSVKTSRRIIVLGSPDGKDGIGDIVRDILIKDKDEYHLSLIRNNSKTISFTKYDIWTKGQVIFLMSGQKSEEIKKLAMKEKDLLVAVLPFVMQPETMNHQDFKTYFERGKQPVILDVRSDKEFKRMHFRGSTFIPYDRILSKMASLEKNREIIVHCHTNRRSAIVSQILVNNGFRNVKKMESGIHGWWEAYGYDYVTVDQKIRYDFIQTLANIPIYSLQKMSFFELNFLKNAIYATNGYEFANDRPWLRRFFCEKNIRKRRAIFTKLPFENKWFLSEYDFPSCTTGADLNKVQIRILAKLRVSLFKKIISLGDIQSIDNTLDLEMGHYQNNVPYWKKAAESLRRELHGYNRMLKIANNINKFDYMELLGVYAGDLLLLKNLIQAKYGKRVEGVIGWEVKEILGVSNIDNKSYDPAKISIQVQFATQMIDEIIQKIQRSNLNDIPESLRKRPEVMQRVPYGYGAC